MCHCMADSFIGLESPQVGAAFEHVHAYASCACTRMGRNPWEAMGAVGRGADTALTITRSCVDLTAKS